MNLFFRPLSSISAVLCLIASFCYSTIVLAASPVIRGTPATAVTVGSTYAFTPRASDADGQRLTFRIANKPAWATFSTATGRLSGTPGRGYIGTYYNIAISVSDGTTRAYLPRFSITVRANRPPTISGSPPNSVAVGSTYAFTPRGYDPDGQTLTFRISNKPAWASFNTATGRLSGTPRYIGTYNNIVISVSDGSASASLASFSITVRANRSPTISGTPAAAVAVGNTYAFTPRGYDPDGQTLTFRISNKPSWASFNTATGRLGGTPASSHVGSYSNIVISVSDGARSASLPAFAIRVNAVSAGTGTVTLSWAVPTQNVDGTRLTNLAGYRVFYGTASRQYSQSVSVPNPAITTVVLEGLATGRTWYFSLKSVNSSGVTSNYSAEARRAL